MFDFKLAIYVGYYVIIYNSHNIIYIISYSILELFIVAFGNRNIFVVGETWNNFKEDKVFEYFELFFHAKIPIIREIVAKEC